jgi:predicted dehydrogenase
MLAGYHTRPLVGLLRERLASGALGEIRSMTVRLCFMGGIYPGFRPTARWRSEIPSAELTTIGSHALVTMLRLIERPVTHVYGVCANRFYAEYAAVDAEDWAELQLAFGGGAVGNILVARVPHRIPGEDIVIEVTGTSGHAHLDASGLTVWPGSESIAPPATSHNALSETFSAYMDALDSGGSVPTSFTDGLILQRVLDAAIESARCRCVMAVGTDSQPAPAS